MHPTAKAILRQLRNEQTQTTAEVIEGVGRAGQTIHIHAKRLDASGLIKRVRASVHGVDAVNGPPCIYMTITPAGLEELEAKQQGPSVWRGVSTVFGACA